MVGGGGGGDCLVIGIIYIQQCSVWQLSPNLCMKSAYSMHKVSIQPPERLEILRNRRYSEIQRTALSKCLRA